MKHLLKKSWFALGNSKCSLLFSFGSQAKKPLMEKMRRARINDSLNELKSLVLESLNKDVSENENTQRIVQTFLLFA